MKKFIAILSLALFLCSCEKSEIQEIEDYSQFEKSPLSYDLTDD